MLCELVVQAAVALTIVQKHYWSGPIKNMTPWSPHMPKNPSEIDGNVSSESDFVVEQLRAVFDPKGVSCQGGKHISSYMSQRN